MPTLSTLIVKLIGDSTGLAGDLKDAEGRVKDFSTKVQDVGQKVSGIGLGLTAAVTAPVMGLFNKAVDGASDFSETLSKANVVFGDSSSKVVAFADNSAKSMGISKQAALEAAGTYGNLFVSMGMTTDKSADMSTSLVQLASDLGSFNNLDPTEVLDKLRAGLTGETEPLKSLGVNINAAAVEAKAMSMGLVKMTVDIAKVTETQFKYDESTRKLTEAIEKYGRGSTQAQAAAIAQGKAEIALQDALTGKAGDLDAATKAQATYALILEQTKTAQGDFARTSDGLANSQRIQTALFNDAAASLGNNLLPYKLKLVQVINDLLAKFNNLSPATQSTIVTFAAVAAAVGPVLLVVGQLITAFGAIMPVLAGFGSVAGAPVIAALAAIAAAGYVLYTAWTENWGGIQEVVGRVVGYIQAIIQMGLNFINGFMAAHSTEIKALMNDAWNGIKTIVQVTLIPLAQQIGSVLAQIAKWIAEHKQTITTIFDGAYNIIVGIVKLAGTTLVGVVKLISSAMQGDFRGMWDAIKGIFTGGVAALAQILGGVVQLGAGIISSLISGIWSQADRFTGALKDFVNKAIGDVGGWLGLKIGSQATDNGNQGNFQNNSLKTNNSMPLVFAKDVPAYTTGINSKGQQGNVNINIQATVADEIDMELLAAKVARTIKRG